MLKQNVLYGNNGSEMIQRLGANSLRFPRRTMVAIILLVALMAFEIFNFDTTRYALTDLLGPVSFLGMRWAAILAIAFCAIDFAGLIRMFTPEPNGEQPKEVWYLMGAWLLGATMNAIMTWWAVSLTLLNHEFGNEVLSRGQLLQIVPIFVATLVWLTRILFIGALTVTGNQLLFAEPEENAAQGKSLRQPAPALMPRVGLGRERQAMNAGHPTLISRNGLPHVTEELPGFLNGRRPVSYEGEEPQFGEAHAFTTQYADELELRPSTRHQREDAPPKRVPRNPQANGRVKQRPPMPGAHGFQARPRRRS